MVTEQVRLEYETYVKECVREGRAPKNPDEFFGVESAPKELGPVAWHRTREQELTFAKFQDIMTRSDVCWNGVNVTLKLQFDAGILK